MKLNERIDDDVSTSKCAGLDVLVCLGSTARSIPDNIASFQGIFGSRCYGNLAFRISFAIAVSSALVKAIKNSTSSLIYLYVNENS